MSYLLGALVRWLIAAAVTYAAVRVVTPGNPSNTLGRALLVTALVTLLLTPMTWFAILIVPLVVAFIAWMVIFMLAYGLGPLQAIGVGLLEIIIGWGVNVVLRALGFATRAPHW
jgi:putative membrane protein